MKRAHRQTLRLVTLAITVLGVAASPASAATFEVTTTADGNDGACDAHCTLREAIAAANLDRDRDIINLPAGTYLLSIPGREEDFGATGDLDILERIELRGSAEGSTIIDGNGIDRVLHVHVMEWQEGDEAVEIRDVTITGGAVTGGEQGGGILNSGALGLEHCTVESNSVRGYRAAGGGIANAGVLALNNVTVRDNVSDGDAGAGGGVWNRFGTMSVADSVISENSTNGVGCDGAGLFSEFGVVSMARVTVSGNQSLGLDSDGGGIWAGFSTVSLINSTISGNAAARGGGIWTDDSTLAVTSCTFSGNSSAAGQVPSDAVWMGVATVVVANTLVDGACFTELDIQSGGGNLESPGSSCGFDRSSDRPGVTPGTLGLGPLADNGGPTPTHALLDGSAAIDSAVSGACPSTDQRGEPRPRDGDGDGWAVCDIGAYEAGEMPQGSGSYSYWLPVAAHNTGANGSVWRTTVGTLNRSARPAELEFVLRTPEGIFSMSNSVAGKGQGVFTDIAGQLGVDEGKGTLEIRSDRPLFVTSRTFNQSDQGTYGQYLAGMTVGEGLRAGETATLPQLAHSAAYRSNLGLANMSSAEATVEVTLHDGGGFEVGKLTVTLEPGQLHQENQVYKRFAGRGDIDGGYATVRVKVGSGVVAYASVVDNGTGDATTIPMWR